MASVNVKSAEFEGLIEKGGIMFVDFWAEWCGPCRMFGSVYEKVSEEFPETIFNQVLNNKEIPEDNSEIEVLKIYQEMYLALQNEDFNKILQLKNLVDKNHAGNSIQDKIIEVEKTITFTASITDESFIDTYDGPDPIFSLENAPIDATIDASTGKFIWTPSTYSSDLCRSLAAPKRSEEHEALG